MSKPEQRKRDLELLEKRYDSKTFRRISKDMNLRTSTLHERWVGILKKILKGSDRPFLKRLFNEITKNYRDY